MKKITFDLETGKNRNERTGLLNQKFPNLLKNSIVCLLILFSINTSLHAQERVKPVWWFGASGAINLNFFKGTTHIQNNTLTLQEAFDDGFGVSPYASALIEYRPGPVWGLMLNFAYDSRMGSFNRTDVNTGKPTYLSTRLDYIAFEPSLRIAPFGGNFYIFLGPRFTYGVHNSYKREDGTSPNTEAEWSDVFGVRFGAQLGMGYEIPLSAPSSQTQVNLSPFISFIPYFGEQPRNAEKLALTTLRIGAAIKFGFGPAPAPKAIVAPPAPLEKVVIAPPVEKDVQFSVQAPRPVPSQHTVKEILPIRDYVFFDAGITQIPARYTILTKSQALGFKEEQLQDCKANPGTRASRQLTVYHNVLNIIGDRMRRKPGITITLIGASGGKGSELGQKYANSVKQYLVSSFGINEARIATEGRNLPIAPSVQPNGTKDLDLLSAEDNRVDIVSTSPDLMLQVKNNPALCLKPVEVTSRDENLLDSPVSVNVKGATETLKTWSLEVTDTKGSTLLYGPFTRDRENLSAQAILKDSPSGDYKIVMIGQTKNGRTVRKESSFSLVRSTTEPSKEELRYSTIFEFDKSKTVDTYKSFLTEIVAPLIPENSTVIISGYTDIIGDEDHNMKLSNGRALDAQKVLESALSDAGKHNVSFQTNGFGENSYSTPFGNKLPEERFYNRTVIIDIISNEGYADKK